MYLYEIDHVGAPGLVWRVMLGYFGFICMIPSAYGETMSECDAESVILDEFWALSDGSWVICWFMLGYFGSIFKILIAYGETMRDCDAECVILGEFWASVRLK